MVILLNIGNNINNCNSFLIMVILLNIGNNINNCNSF